VGLCVPQAFLNAVMLRLKGYKAEVVYGSIYEDEELIGHAWVETKIDGKDYIASWENLYPRSAYYDEWIMRP
jgi:transglutaminase-like putative cysteine protease